MDQELDSEGLDTGREILLHRLVERAVDLPPDERRAFLDAECGGNAALVEEALAHFENENALGDFLEAPAADAVFPEQDPAVFPRQDPAVFPRQDPAVFPRQDPWDDSHAGDTTLAAGVPPPAADENTTDTLAAGVDPRGLPAAIDFAAAARAPRPKIPRQLGSRDVRIGPYRLLEVLGEGGMGCVYLAEQRQPVKRRVAIKLIRTSLASVDAQARFHAERQAMARLAHANVAQMFEAGTTEDGFPYFVMELVPGTPITRYSDQHQLSVDQRLELFVAVCHGVQHAHQKQILHRDLKPSNILVAEVDGKPVPKIIDFGIAKALDQPLTDADIETGAHRIGTPSYMSPEALRVTSERADLDTRSDVYALGVVLYELLTGSRPFKTEGSSHLDLMHEIIENEAPRPSTRVTALAEATGAPGTAHRRAELAELRRRLAEDLDWIVLKAIARESGDRYASAAELAADVERHLRDEPVLAHPTSFRYRTRKLIRRHRFAAALAAMVAASLVLGVAATSLALWKARRAEAWARTEAEAASQAREEAEEVVDFLAGLFRESSAYEASSHQPRSWDQLTAHEIFERGAERLADDELAGRPLTQARLSATIGDVYKQNGLYEAAREFHRRALELRRRELPDGDRRIADSWFKLGLVANAGDRLAEAEEDFQRALEIYQAQPQPDPAARAAVVDELGELRSKTGDYEEAEKLLREALTLRQEVLGPAHADVAVSLNSLALLYFRQARYAEAEEYFRRGLEIQRRRLPRGHPVVVQALNNLAAAQASQGRLEEAAPVFEEALALRIEVLGEDHPAVAESLNNLAVLYTDLGRTEEVETLHRRALAIREKAFGPEHEMVAWSVRNLAMHYLDEGRLADAEPLFLRALAIRAHVFGADGPAAGDSLHDLGRLREAQGRWEEARSLFARALTIRERAFDPGHRSIGRSAQRLGVALCALGRRQDGEAQLVRAAEILGDDMPGEPTCAAQPGTAPAGG
jgi:eukaryotic-like serine/threonine-protein kinase